MAAAASQQPDWSTVLNSAAPGGKPYPPLLVVWGRAGIGKTRFALAQTPKPCVLAFEVGARSVKGTHVFPSEGTVQTWEEALTYLRALAYGLHHYQTVALDSLLPMEALCLAYSVRQSGKGTYEKMGWGREAAVASEFRIALGLLERIKARGIQVIVTAHDRNRKDKDPTKSDTRELVGSTLVPEVWEALVSWADVVGFACDDYGVVEGKPVKVTDARRLHTIKGPGFVAKQRAGYEMVSPVALDWRSFSEALAAGSESAETVVQRITALALDCNTDVTRYVTDAAGDVAKLLELENALKVHKEKMQ